MTATPRHATLEVAGMTCTDCEHHVTAALEQAGAEQVSADFRRGVARFTWPQSAGEAALRAAAARAGYTPGSLRVESPGAAAARAGEADYDLLVLGAGSAAFAAAIRGRDAGYRVALAEAGTLGGTCVNVGCVPSKALLAAGAAYWAAGHHRFAGVTTAAGIQLHGGPLVLPRQPAEHLRSEIQQPGPDLGDLLTGQAGITPRNPAAIPDLKKYY